LDIHQDAWEIGINIQANPVILLLHNTTVVQKQKIVRQVYAVHNHFKVMIVTHNGLIFVKILINLEYIRIQHIVKLIMGLQHNLNKMYMLISLKDLIIIV